MTWWYYLNHSIAQIPTPLVSVSSDAISPIPESSSVILNCTITLSVSETLTLDIVWIQPGEKPIFRSILFTGGTFIDTIEIKSVMTTDGGNYMCNANISSNNILRLPSETASDNISIDVIAQGKKHIPHNS